MNGGLGVFAVWHINLGGGATFAPVFYPPKIFLPRLLHSKLSRKFSFQCKSLVASLGEIILTFQFSVKM